MLARFILGDAGTQPRTAAEAGLPLLRDWETTADSGLRHTRGSLGFARDILGDGSVAPDIFIALEDIPEFNFGSDYSPGKLGFPVAGRVVSGMDVVERIAAGPRSGKSYFAFLDGQILSNPVTLTRVARVDR